MEAGTAPQAAEGATEGAAAPQGPDFSAVMDRIEGLEGSFSPVIDWVQQQQAASQEPEQTYEDFVADLFGQQEGGAAAEPQQPQQPAALQDPQVVAQLVQHAVQRQLQESVTPELQALREERFQRDVTDLVERIPALQDPKVAQETTLAAQQFSQRLAQRLNRPDLADELWRDPAVIEDIYLANVARQRSDAEDPADVSGGEARLEGSGANPGQPDGPGLAQQLIQAHRGDSGSDYRWF